MRKTVAEIMAYIANVHPSLRITPEMVRVWSGLLDRFTDEQLWRAARGVAMREHYGPPSCAALIVEIEGVERTIQVPVRDLDNRLVLRDDHSYKTQPQLVRWFPDGRHEEALGLPKHDPNVIYDGGLGHIGGDLNGLLGDGETLTDPDN